MSNETLEEFLTKRRWEIFCGQGIRSNLGWQVGNIFKLLSRCQGDMQDMQWANTWGEIFITAKTILEKHD